MTTSPLAGLPGLSEIQAERCRRSFPVFIRHAWPHVVPDEFVDSWMVDAIGEHLQALAERKIRRLIINMPPRMAKSTYSSVMFPAWLWLRDPSFRCVTNSYSAELAERDARGSRKLIDTPWFQSLNAGADGHPIFEMKANIRGRSRLKDTDNLFENSRGGFRLALGVNGSFTGRGGHGIGVDDPQDPQGAYSEAERLSTLRWWDQTVPTRLDNPRTGLKWIVMQRLHAFDLTGHVIQQELDYTHLKIPMRYKPSSRCVTVLGPRTWQDPRAEEGELLQPERFDPASLKEIETTLGPYGIAGQLQQEPLPDGGGTFRLEWFRRWGTPEVPTLPVFDRVCMSVDAAFGESSTSSYVVLQVWGFRGTDAFLLDQWRKQADFMATLAALRDLHAKFKATGTPITHTLIERKANGEALISALGKQFPGVVKDRDDKHGISPKESKEARASAVAPQLAAGRVFLPPDAPWVADFLVEAVNFPKYRSDDQVDAMTQALSWWHLGKGALILEDARRKWEALGRI